MLERVKEKFRKWIKTADLPGYLSPVFRIIAVILVSVGQEVLHGLPQTRHFLHSLKIFYTNHPIIAALLFTIVALMVGLSASLWKKHSIKTYAAGEIIFGCSVAFSVLKTLAPQFDFSKLFAIGSAIYVISRGFNNLSDANKKVPLATRALAKTQ